MGDSALAVHDLSLAMLMRKVRNSGDWSQDTGSVGSTTDLKLRLMES